MPWAQNTSPSDPPELSPISTCCLHCAAELGTTPDLQCTRPHVSKPCTQCITTRKPCKPIPMFLQSRIAELREIGNQDERKKATARLTKEVESYEKYCRTHEEDGNRLLKSLNRNVFRLVQLKRMEMGMPTLGEEEEEIPRVFGGLV